MNHRHRTARPWLLVLYLVFAAGGCSRTRPPDPAYVAQIEAWHAERVASLRQDSGWLTLVGLHPLREGRNELGSGAECDVRLIEKAPAHVGTIEARGDSLVFRAAPEADVRLSSETSGARITSLRLVSDADTDPTRLACGSLVFYVIERGEQLFLRVKDRESEALTTFAGIRRFPVDPRWRVTARLEVDPSPQTVPVPDVLGHVSESPCPGTLVFSLAGKTCRLRPVGAPGEPLFIVFGDLTNGRSTYGGGRFLDADAPDSNGLVVLDFNLAINPPCAFTPYATCPLPPVSNLLPLAVEAGEMSYGDHHAQRQRPAGTIVPIPATRKLAHGRT